MNPITIVTIDDTHRLVLEYDQFIGTDPRNEYDGHQTAFVAVERTNYTAPADLYSVAADVKRAHEFLYGTSRWAYASRDEPVQRWLNIFHGLAAEYDWEYGGYWVFSPEGWAKAQGTDVPLPTVGTQREIIAAERETYRQWAEGEVYTVTAQELIHYVRINETEPTIDYDDNLDQWRDVDSIGGIYRDDESYTLPDENGVRRVANDYFDQAFETEDVKA